ncbi:MAG: hypothetical protein COU07_00595 [Candidatus Harrisonbacteria bacterium CG10_big_fil_rev_8_21_14_0_10_40_38]|uniref:Uncharacterized protein n=1 Tax=Candidatus Harrisonbacteria bacterium CG10_big_fil_rev_8_21_14_0_10_40_38 TaxID=1974583 RepID=A0A2H0USJ3_9BACT|nr:MAG: hypothetical protein COU07_00595 [Candidatus Harrisonbacteria bacterium CG10_big_fil_rev_8_21_14_0_10_40_38]
MRTLLVLVFVVVSGCAVEERIPFTSFVYNKTEGVCVFTYDDEFTTSRTVAVPEHGRFSIFNNVISKNKQYAIVEYYPEIFRDRTTRLEIHYFPETRDSKGEKGDEDKGDCFGGGTFKSGDM